ncbi:ABC-2 transporter permease [Lentibacillus juripiscarius]|uniref:ABC-2 transporter permease n=1 Tax=Lentibacillus juripiscarius TaxID=257446 RepID=A0ABW5V1G7_9BACI
MWMLIRRELDNMVTINLRRSFQAYIIFGLVFVLFMWLLGPRVIGYFEAEMFSLFVFMAGMLSAVASMLFTIEEDDAERQISFLQTLPIRKRDIVHAKFLSIFLVCGFMFIWVSVLNSANLLMNDVWTMESWMDVFIFLAVLIFLVAENLLWYFLRGLRSNWIFYFSFIAWMTVLVLLGFNRPSGISQSVICGVSLISSFLAYPTCWWLSVRKVHHKGFPLEKDNPGRKNTEKHIEELKRRQSERQS